MRGRPPIRDALLTLADFLPDVPLAVVVAPAGSGRSTLLEAWRTRLGDASRQTAWLDLSPLHDDAGLLLDDLVDVLRGAGRAPGRRIERLRSGPDDADPELAAGLLARALADRARPLFLFLEDHHRLTAGSAGARLLGALVDASAPGLHLVLSSRGALPVAVPRLRARDQLVEVGREDLLLHADAVATVLRRHGVDPEPGLVAPLLAQTEGWAAGVVLAARLLAQRPPEARADAVAALARAPDLFAYFAEEVLSGEDEATRSLLQTAALLGPARRDDLARAADLEAGVVDACLDLGLLQAHGDEVRLPGLWQGLLRERLAAGADAGDRELRLRAAVSALLARERTEQAAALAADFGHEGTLAAMLERHGESLLGLGRRAAVRGWLARLPDEVRDARPRLRLVEGLAWLDADAARAERCLRAAQAGFRRAGDAAEERRTVGALVQVCLGDGRMREAAELARAQVSVMRLLRDPAVRGDLLTALAGRSLLGRRFTRSLRLSERAMRYPIGADSRWLNAMNRILLHTLRGESRRALRVAEEALSDVEITGHGLPRYSLRVLRALPRAMLGEVEDGLAEGSGALEALRRLGFRRSLMAGAVPIATIEVLAGRTDDGLARLAETTALAREVGNVALEAMARAEMAFLLASTGAPGAQAEAEAAHQAFVQAERGRNEAWPWLWARALWALAATGPAKRAWDEAQPREAMMLARELPLVHHTAALVLSDVARRAGAGRDAARLAGVAWTASAEAGLERTLPELPREMVVSAARDAFAGGTACDHALERLRLVSPRTATGFLEALALDPDEGLAERAVSQMGRIGDRAFHAVLDRKARSGPERVRRAARGALEQLDPRPRYRLRFESLGRFRAWRDEEEIGEREWRGLTGRRLLFRLLLADGRVLSRARLLEELWPDIEPDTARSHLRVALSRLNEALEPDRPGGAAPWFVQSEGDGLCWNAAAPAEWDAIRWDEEAARSLAAGSGPEERSRQAELLAQYRGPLLPDLPDEPWLDPLRQRLQERFSSLGRALATSSLEAGELDAADDAALRLLEADEADEPGWALRIRVRLERGERTAALRLYGRARETLRRELDVEPGPELAALAREAGARS